MGQCVLRDCGLDQQTPPSRLESILKQHLQEKYYEGFIEKHANGTPIKDKDFNSSLDYPKTRTILPKKMPKRAWKEGEGEVVGRRPLVAAGEATSRRASAGRGERAARMRARALGRCRAQVIGRQKNAAQETWQRGEDVGKGLASRVRTLWYVTHLHHIPF